MARSTHRRAFTLIEIIVCMALFAAGFAAVAAMLPAGVMMEKDFRSSADATICGRNALEIMKGKGVGTLVMEFLTRAAQPGNSLMPLNCGPMPTKRAYVPDQHDMENATDYLNLYRQVGWDMRNDYDTGGGNIGAHLSQLSSEAYRLRDFWDTNANNCVWQGVNAAHQPNAWTGRNTFSWPTDKFWLCFMDHPDGVYSNVAIDDHTHWGMGRIHVYKNRRPQPYSSLDFSYPSSILDISARTQVTSVQFCNLSSTKCGYDYRFADPLGNIWKLVAITTTATNGAEWPEQNVGSFYIPTTDMRPRLTANCGDTRGNPIVTAVDPSYWTENWIRGMCDYKTMCGYEERAKGISSGAYNNVVPWGPSNYASYVASAARDADGKYKLPVPLAIPAIIYDKDKDLLLLRYPLPFQKAGSAWIDRKLKIGDSFVTNNGGFLLRVKDVLDAESAAAAAPYGPVTWSDGTYQIIRVTPSLATLPFTNNKSAYLTMAGSDNGIGSNNEWTEPYLKSVIVAPPPVTGGASPWAATAQLQCGNNTAVPYSNQNPFRPWANTAE